MSDSLRPQERPSTPDETAESDEQTKAAAKCRECGAVYSAWIHPDNSVHPIGRKDGCRCGADDFQEISKQPSRNSSTE